VRYLRLIFWFLTAAYWVTLCVLTHLPPTDLPRMQVDDKMQHFLSYGMLGGMLGMAMWVTFPRRPLLIWGVLAFGLAYGALDEQTQKLVGRVCDLDDWIADAVGTMAGVLPVLVLQRFVRIPPRPRHKAAAGDRPPVVLGDTFGPELEAALHACCPAPQGNGDGDAHGDARGDAADRRARVRRVG
jgi:VanZ family protein